MLNRIIANPTQLTGLLSFAAATIACLIAASRSVSRDARIWHVLALVNCLFLLEVYFGLRHRITNIAIDALKTRGLYSQLHGLDQAMVITAIAAIALVFGMLFIFWRQADRAATRLAGSIIIAVSTLFAIETISLHAIDAVFYRPIGPVLMIGWLWTIAAVAMCLAATARA